MVYFNLQTTQKDSENGNNNKQKQTTSYVKPVLHNYLFFQGSWKHKTGIVTWINLLANIYKWS